jgi:hypothetical protein
MTQGSVKYKAAYDAESPESKYKSAHDKAKEKLKSYAEQERKYKD